MDSHADFVRAALRKPRARGDRGGWLRVLTRTPVQMRADRDAIAVNAREGTLVADPTNRGDPRAVQVRVGGRTIGYVEAWEAAHIHASLLDETSPPVVQLRPAQRKTSPLFDVWLPDLHPEGISPTQCPVCKVVAMESRHHRYGPL